MDTGNLVIPKGNQSNPWDSNSEPLESPPIDQFVNPTMASVMKPFRAEDSGFKSNNLWVGSLTTDTTESDLTELFGRFGDIDRITAYSSRSFAFIYYRRVEEAVAAKEALQGANLNGSQIKIEYARPVCSYLFVSLGLYRRLFPNFDCLLSTITLFLRIHHTPGSYILIVFDACLVKLILLNLSFFFLLIVQIKIKT